MCSYEVLNAIKTFWGNLEVLIFPSKLLNWNCKHLVYSLDELKYFSRTSYELQTKYLGIKIKIIKVITTLRTG